MNCLRFMGSATPRARNAPARTAGSPRMRSAAAGRRVADLRRARIVDAHDVAGVAHFHEGALPREELRGWARRISFRGARAAPHPPLDWPEQMRRNATRSRWALSMFAWILKTKPENRASSGATVPMSYARAGRRAHLHELSRNGASAEVVRPAAEKHGRHLPARKRSRSNASPAASSSSISSRKLIVPSSSSSPSERRVVEARDLHGAISAPRLVVGFALLEEEELLESRGGRRR